MAQEMEIARGPAVEADDSSCAPSFTKMQKFALWVDGMTRILLFPLGAVLLQDRLIPSTTYNQLASSVQQRPGWVVVPYCLSAVASVYLLGRWVGGVMRCRIVNRRPHQHKGLLAMQTARCGGLLIALNCITYGYVQESAASPDHVVRWLMIIRFVAGILSGLLPSPAISEVVSAICHSDKQKLTCSSRGVGPQHHNNSNPLKIWTKLYLIGMAVAVGMQGLWSIQKDATTVVHQAAMTVYQFIMTSFVFWIIVGLAAEWAIRTWLASWLLSDTQSSSRAHTVTTSLTHKKLEDSASCPSDAVNLEIGAYHRPVQGSYPGLDAACRGPTEQGSLTVPWDRVASTQVAPVAIVPRKQVMAPRAARARLESNTSVDEFYDCRSIFSDMMMSEQDDSSECDQDSMSRYSISLSHNPHAVSTYVHGRCIYPDGSPAYVPSGDVVMRIPPNYLAFYKNNVQRATQAWHATQRWRLEKRVWKIHTLPNPWFERIKQAYPHFVHGHSKAGYPIIYEQPGRMNLKQLFRSGCQIADMVHHYTYFMEFVSNRICTRPEVRQARQLLQAELPQQGSPAWGIMVVMDVQGAGLSHLSGDVILYLKQAGDINSAHYPLSMKRAFLVNSPFWLAGAWSGIKGILPESVQVDILSPSRYASVLQEYIDADQIPPEYGGSSPYPLGEHPYEQELRQLIQLRDRQQQHRNDMPPLEITASVTPDRTHEVYSSSAWEADPNHLVSSNCVSPFDPSSKHLDTPLGKRSSAIPLRRRVHSVDRVCNQQPQRRKGELSSSVVKIKAERRITFASGDQESFFRSCVVRCAWTSVHGVLEVYLPLWMMSSATMGGLGYTPPRSAVVILCSLLVLLWVARKDLCKSLIGRGEASPLQAFRVAAGLQAALLGLVAVTSCSVFPERRMDSVALMATVIIAIAAMAIVRVLGDEFSHHVHKQVSQLYLAHNPSMRSNGMMSRSLIAAMVASGDGDSWSSVAVQVAGVWISAPMTAWSLGHEPSSAVNGTFLLFAMALTALVICMLSCIIRLDIDNASKDKDRCSLDSSNLRQCLPLVGEALATSAGDLASHLEEANWSSSPLLMMRAGGSSNRSGSGSGGLRSRAFSEASGCAEMMERGCCASSSRPMETGMMMHDVEVADDAWEDHNNSDDRPSLELSYRPRTTLFPDMIT